MLFARMHLASIASLLLLANVPAVALFGLADHKAAVIGSFEKAESLRANCSSVDVAHIEAGKNPLVAACDSRPVFIQYLLGLRHLLVLLSPDALPRGVAEVDLNACLTLAGELDVELGQLVVAGRADKYFYWHGPKRHVPAKVQDILDCTLVKEKLRVRDFLKASGNDDGKAGFLANKKLPDGGGVGLSFPTSAHTIDDKFFSAAALRLHDSTADVCDMAAKAVKAGVKRLVIAGKVAEDYLKKCVDVKLEVILDMSDYLSTLFEDASEEPLQDAIGRALKALGRSTLDVLALPAWVWSDKRLKGYIVATTAELLKSGQVKTLAVAGTLASKQIEKLSTTNPPPTLWLAPHDDCAPAASVALKAAAKASWRILAYGVPCDRSIFNHVATREGMSEVALLARWSGELGMGAALDESAVDLATELESIRKAKALSEDSWMVLSSLAAFTLNSAQAASADYMDTFGLRAMIAKVASLAQLGLTSSAAPANGALGAAIWTAVEQDRKQFDQNYFIIYKDNFLSPEVYERIQKEAARLWKSPDLEPNCNLDGNDRAGGYVIDAESRDNSLYSFFYKNEEFRRWVSTINGHLMFPSDFPIELREYPSGSTGMGCHRDLLMFRNATLDMEFVYTIDNFGTCISTFDDRTGKTTEVHTQGNSLIMVRPNAAMHCVKPATDGHRTILKFIFVGDYHKSPQFSYYTENECGSDNPNVQILAERRKSLLAAEL